MPNKYVLLGAVKTSFKLVSAGLNGAISGANTAIIIKNSTIDAPLIRSILLLVFENILLRILFLSIAYPWVCKSISNICNKIAY